MTLGEAGPAKRERAALERNGEKCRGDSAMLNLESPEECWDSASLVTSEVSWIPLPYCLAKSLATVGGQRARQLAISGLLGRGQWACGVQHARRPAQA